MKKVFLLATAVLMVAGIALADTGKKKKAKKCAKGKTCCTKSTATAEKSCCKDKAKTVAM
ncbi:hypothetical protein [Ferruginibacter sp.]|nr:hypothetical protein [Ferruginibacter sp.]